MTSKRRLDFFIRKQQWLDLISVSLAKDHFTAHTSMVLARHMNSETGETFVGRETIADLTGGHVRTVERSVQKLEALGFVIIRRSRGRGHANTYVMTFPEKAVSTPPITEEKAAPTPPFSTEEKAVSEPLKGGLSDDKRRSPRRPNLQEYNLQDLTLEKSGIEKAAGAALPAAATSASPARPLLIKPATFDRPKPGGGNRGEYEQRLAIILTEAGLDGWDVLMTLEEHKVAALCRRLRNGVLKKSEIQEVCSIYRRKPQAKAAGVAHG